MIRHHEVDPDRRIRLAVDLGGVATDTRTDRARPLRVAQVREIGIEEGLRWSVVDLSIGAGPVTGAACAGAVVVFVETVGPVLRRHGVEVA